MGVRMQPVQHFSTRGTTLHGFSTGVHWKDMAILVLLKISMAIAIQHSVLSRLQTLCSSACRAIA